MTGQPTAPAGAVSAVSGRADTAVRVAMSAVVSGVAVIAAVISYRHAFELVAGHGEDGVTARLVPLTVDGLVVAASLVLLHAARSHRPAPGLARVLLVAGIVATLGANVAHGLAFGPVGAVVAGWPALAFLGCSELALLLIRASVPAGGSGPSTAVSAAPVLPWVPDTLPVRADITPDIRADLAQVGEITHLPERVTGADGKSYPAAPRGTESTAPTRSTARSDVDRVRALLADRPDASGADIARTFGVSARHGRRLRAAALNGRTN